MTDSNEIVLLVDGQAYGGWERVEIKRSLEHMAGGFALQLTTKWDGQREPYQLREGLPCEVRIGSDTVITGYIDDYDPSGDDQSHTITVNGRDKTGDLVDCAAVHKTGQWHGAGLQQIVNDIAQPFGIAVMVDAGVDLGAAFKSFSLQEGERAFDAIDRACRMRAVLCTSTPQGDVLLTQASQESTGVQLIEGVNILKYQAHHSWRERFSQVTIKGQGPGDDDESGEAVAHGKAVAQDKEINRYRPLVVVAEHGAGLKSLQDRAAWEVQVRMGRGKRGQVTVNGWRTGRDGLVGPLWQPNRNVYIDSPSMFLAADMLIVSCSYSITEKGKLTELAFARPEAFAVVSGVRRSSLGGRLNHRTQKEKHKKGGGYESPWELTPPTKGTP